MRNGKYAALSGKLSGREQKEQRRESLSLTETLLHTERGERHRWSVVVSSYVVIVLSTPHPPPPAPGSQRPAPARARARALRTSLRRRVVI
eukprot:scaffold7412_cov123-Isochrysis_galbana.AAC.11